MLPGWMIKDDDISFNYTLAGGSMMNLGTYHFAALRLLFAAEPEECLTCNTENFKQEGKQKIDYNFHATFRFPGGGIGEAKTMMRGKSTFKTDFTTVRLREEVIADPNLSSAQEKVRSRTLKLWGMFHGVVWHRIDIIDTYTIRDIKTLKITKTWTEKSIRKAYTFKEAGGEFARFKGEDSWMSFRHQLEQFVNRVKGRETQYWVGREDSIRQMKMVDLAYEKSGLGARQTSKFALEL
jgi:predicted dehydrogenase